MAGRAVRSWHDKRAFAVFDVGYLDNPKIMHVFDASAIAVCMHFASVLYCAQHLTDGLVSPRTIQRKVGGTDADTQLLVDEKLWHRPGHDCEHCPDVPKGKVYVHDYTSHNRTSEGVKRASEAGKRGAEARWNGDVNADAKANAKRMRFASEPHSDPQSEPQCESDEIAMARQTDRQTLKDSSKSDEEFDRWYAGYPRKEAKAAARKAFAKARKSVDVDTLITALARYVDSVKGKDRQYIALPASWLNAGRWEDEYAPAQRQQVPALYAHFNQ